MPPLFRRPPITDPGLPAPPRRRGASGLEELRGGAMRRLYPKLHGWRAGPRETGAALRAYAFLCGAQTIEDLQARIGAVEHGYRAPRRDAARRGETPGGG
jgi:hypothetical protein